MSARDKFNEAKRMLFDLYEEACLNENSKLPPEEIERRLQNINNLVRTMIIKSDNEQIFKPQNLKIKTPGPYTAPLVADTPNSPRLPALRGPLSEPYFRRIFSES